MAELAGARVVFKGSRDGVFLQLDERAELEDILAELRDKLRPSRRFFSGGKVRVQASPTQLNDSEWRRIEETVKEFGLHFHVEGAASDGGEVNGADVHAAMKEAASGETFSFATWFDGDVDREAKAGTGALVLRRTLRSGQKIHHDGTVVVLGDVNPGAEVVCSGDIVVLGALRGVAHAGVGGASDAVVIAFHLEPTQLRIGQFISRAPDEKVPHPDGPEIASVKDGLIQITSYEP